jgi:hypothetical protein
VLLLQVPNGLSNRPLLLGSKSSKSFCWNNSTAILFLLRWHFLCEKPQLTMWLASIVPNCHLAAFFTLFLGCLWGWYLRLIHMQSQRLVTAKRFYYLGNSRVCYFFRFRRIHDACLLTSMFPSAVFWLRVICFCLVSLFLTYICVAILLFGFGWNLASFFL